jgi:hypothetical protein
MIGYIYSLTDPRDNQIKYIGQTRFTIKKRYREHLRNCKYDATKNHSVYSWINELLDLEMQPIINIVEIIDVNFLNEREKFWISQYSNNLKNMTSGGDGIKFINKRPFSNEHRKKIGDSCRGDKHYRFGKSAHNIRSIYQFDLIDGRLLNEFKSIKEAVKKTGISQPSISFCLTGERNSGGNFIWIYKEAYDNNKLILEEKQRKAKEKPSNKYRSIKIAKIDIISNDIIEIYDSMRMAARKNNTTDSAIRYACDESKTHIYKNFKWKIL